MTTQQPREREAARRVLRELVYFCISNSPEALAREVGNVEGTLGTLMLLKRWFERYEAALPPRVQ
jgi:hypothetical protein